MAPRIAGIAIKEEHRQPLVEVERAEIVESGLVGNVSQSDRRRVTLMAREQWEAVQSELGTDLPWITRRANILTEGLTMGGLMGKSLKIGDAELLVEGETVPCDLMDEYFHGLKEVLTPDCRGGVYARVIRAGEIGVGDTISVLGQSHE